MHTVELRLQHRRIVLVAARLGGLSGRIRTRGDAQEARTVIESIDQMLIDHLTVEDDLLYPALLSCDDATTRAMAADCFEEMGGIRGAWIAYRDQWTVAAIAIDPARFSAATTGMLGALALRVARENTELYPAMDALMQRDPVLPLVA